jgi:hypothetical protein
MCLARDSVASDSSGGSAWLVEVHFEDRSIVAVDLDSLFVEEPNGSGAVEVELTADDVAVAAQQRFALDQRRPMLDPLLRQFSNPDIAEIQRSGVVL